MKRKKTKISSDITYKELKEKQWRHVAPVKIGGSDITYKELKMEIMNLEKTRIYEVQILPIRN